MKKSILVVISITFFILLFSSCESKFGENEINLSQEQRAIIPDMGIKASDFKWITIHGLDLHQKYLVFIAENDMNDFINLVENELGYTWSFPYYEKPKLEQLELLYDKTFFDNNILVMINLTQTSTSIKTIIDRIYITENKLNVKGRNLLPKASNGNIALDEAMAYRHLYIPVNKEHFDGKIVNIDIVYETIK